MKQTGMFERVRFLEARLDRLEAVILRQDEELRFLRCEGKPEPVGLGTEPSSVRMAEIAAIVAADNGLTVAELRGTDRAFTVSHPRQYAYALMLDAGHSSAAVARFFRRDHSTVITGAARARARMDKAPA